MVRVTLTITLFCLAQTALAHPLIFESQARVPIRPGDETIIVARTACGPLSQVNLAEFKYEFERSLCAEVSEVELLDIADGRAQEAFLERLCSQLALECLTRSKPTTAREPVRRAVADEMARSLLRSVTSTATVSPLAVRRYYDEHQREFLQAEVVDVARITLPSRAAASEALDELADGRRFEEVARSHSVDPFAKRGGRWGAFRTTYFTSTTGDLLASLAPGETTSAVVLPRGRFGIFRLLGRVPSRPRDFDQVRVPIEATLVEEGEMNLQDRYLEDLRSLHRCRYVTASASLVLEPGPPEAVLRNPLLVFGPKAVSLREFWKDEQGSLRFLALRDDRKAAEQMARQWCDRRLLRRHVESRYDDFRRRWPYIEASVRRRAIVARLSATTTQGALVSARRRFRVVAYAARVRDVAVVFRKGPVLP